MDLPALVRAGDYGRFLAIQLAPRSSREALYALTAFSLEMHRIPSLVTEPVAGFMRYAWWRESIEEMASGQKPRHHPLLQALATLDPSVLAACLAIIEASQHALEQDAIHPAMDDATAALDRAWRMLGGEKSLAALDVLMENNPTGRIGPRQIIRLIFYGLR
jgi:phytoene/squalene synthetase